ncbi:MAG: TIM44-like domain-containing protein, partial [Nitrospirae bacterium]|nr:TIM44-like domain-containing protein [Nitrospirota bacterium]
DENEMKETARNVFISFYTAQESGNTKQIEPLLFPEIYNALQKNIIQRKEKGEAVEFRNLCVRKVDIILIRNFTDNTNDEFTVRLAAHAQKVFKRNNEIIRQDEYVAPSEHYWTFGRKENQWLLKEILPSVSKLAGKTDIDEDATKEQIEWYHTKDRAL